jgi:hypothetical protein
MSEALFFAAGRNTSAAQTAMHKTHNKKAAENRCLSEVLMKGEAERFEQSADCRRRSSTNVNKQNILDCQAKFTKILGFCQARAL